MIDDDEKTLWEKDIDNAESGNPKLHFYEDIRFLTELTAELWNIVDARCPDELDQDFTNTLWWYFSTEEEKQDPNKTILPVTPPVKNQINCKCDSKTLFNFGCQCKREKKNGPKS